MNKLHSILSAAILLGTAIPATHAAVELSVDFFHDNLASYGDWREVGDYGYCWQPRDVERDWRPYSDGHWLYTDAGWTWDSDEPYSWAVYHYGRWARVDQVGWVWVPDTEWGPAWVSWRHSPRHIGWAPLPPEAQFSRTAGFGVRVDADYDIGPMNYSFVEVRNFGAPHLRTVFIEPRENITIIQQTTNITRITYVNNVVYNQGPQYDVISRETAQPIRRLRLERRAEFDGDPRTVRAEQLMTRVEGDSLRVVAPTFDKKPATAPKKVAAKVEKAEVDRGWKNAGPPADVEKVRARIKTEPATAAEPPPQPKREKSTDAPAVSPDTIPVPGKKPAKVDGGPATRPAAPDQPAKPGKPTKVTKPINPDASGVQSSPPATENAAPTGQSKNGRNKAGDDPRLPGKALPQENVPARKPKIENVEPTRKQPPTAVEPAQQKVQPRKQAAQPKPEQAAVPSIKHRAPNKPEPLHQTKRPEPHKQAAPAVTQPQPPAKAKGKSKDEKKGAAKPEDVPQ